MRYIVRPTIGAHDKQFSGKEGGSGTIVYSETPSKARQLGAKKLGLQPHQVEVLEHDDVAPVFGEDRPLTQEEANEIYNQPTEVQPGTWESV